MEDFILEDVEAREVTVRVKPYDRSTGVVSWWEPNAQLSVSIVEFSFGREIDIQGNRDGLVSLARFLLTLAQDEVPNGRDILLDSEELDGESETLRILIQEP
ncbi:hypothetical protein [Glycomyces algeriensis]|uniref:Imm32 family immunity protein n=1 Tax=Glycomyces algeriensis TaxID=256037 RepID=UPI0022DA5A51|nr:hypothetical protein [Glycomyces algeriensis]MDA1368276.1 hypothetical protein [Glycomyces algeriensis]MDR7351916.1 hypothetical protein [Glycomyces algeriensis]